MALNQHTAYCGTFFENLKGQIIIACTCTMCVYACAQLCVVLVYLYTFLNGFESVRSTTALHPFLLFQLDREARCLRSVSYCELIILRWNCVRARMVVCVYVCVCMCVF